MINQWSRYVIVHVLLVLFCGSAFAMIDNKSAPVALQFLSKEEGGHLNVPRILPFNERDLLPAGIYQVQTKVRLATEPVVEVVNSRFLSFQPVKNAMDRMGWRETSGVFTGFPGQKFPSLYLPFSNTSKASDKINLLDFDELWFDLEEITPGDACDFIVQVDGAQKTSLNAVSLRRGLSHSKHMDTTVQQVKNLNIYAVDWLTRNTKYLVMRELGFGFNRNWHYYQKGRDVVIERRFHESLSRVQVIDLWLAPGAQIGGGHLRVSWGDHLKWDAIYSWDSIPKKIEVTAEGLHIRLYPGEIGEVQGRLTQITSVASKKNDVFLSELALYVQGTPQTVVDKRVLKAVGFQKGRQRFYNFSINLPQHKKKLAAGLSRFVVDLRSFSRDNWQALNFSEGAIIVKSPRSGHMCRFKPKSIRLVALGEGRQSSILGEMTRFDQSLGGPFLQEAEASEKVEWIITDTVLKFKNRSSLVSSLDNKEDLNPSGLKWKAATDGHFIKASKVLQGLKLTGRGGALNFSWSHPVRLVPGSRLFLKIPQGEKYIQQGSVHLQFKDGEQASFEFQPNQALLLGDAHYSGKVLQEIGFHFKMRDVPFRVTLGELSVFHPLLIKKESMLQMPLPGGSRLSMAPSSIEASNQLIVHRKDNILYGMTVDEGPSRVRWRTVVNQPTQALESLQLHYGLETLNGALCWLTVTFQGEHHTATSPICFDGKKGLKSEPLTYLLREFDPDEKIEFIEWRAELPSSLKGASFELESSLVTNQGPSTFDILKKYPLLTINDQIVHPVEVAQTTQPSLIDGGSAWLNLGKVKMPAGYFSLQLSERYPYFRLQQVALDTQQAPTKQQWLRISGKNQSSSDGGRRVLLLILAGLVLLLVWLKREAVGSLWRRVQISSRILIQVLLNHINVAYQWTCSKLHRFKKPLNRMLGAVVVLGLGLFNLNGEVVHPPLLGFMVLLGFGVLWYEWCWYITSRGFLKRTTECWFGSADRISPVILTVTAIVIGWTIWSLGGGLTLGCFLPLMAIGYCYLPWLSLFACRLRPDYRWMLFWLIIMAGLYLLGLQSNITEGENYYFSFGALTAVLVWRSYFRAVRGFIERHWAKLASLIYRDVGSLYFSGALINLVLVMLLLLIKLDPLAEQVAIVVYYLLVLGVVLELLALRRGRIKND